MKDLLETLASLKLVVFVIVLLLLGLGVGTIVESFNGAEVAAQTVYHSWWLFGLLELFGACIVASLIALYPWGKRRIGYATVHIALGLILGGAVLTHQRGLEGELLIWKGESANEIMKYDSKGNVIRRHTLPFDIALEDFRIERYPGTQQPSGYRSDIKVTYPSGATLAAGIWMNHELTLWDWQFYQARYRIEEDRVATVLLASSDPGRPLVFLGYIALLIGLGIVIGTRIVEARQKRAGIVQTPGHGNERHALLWGLAAVISVASGVTLSLDLKSSDATNDILRHLPVQHDGRVMPLDTLARESVQGITGKRAWQGADPTATVLSWMFDGSKTLATPLLPIESTELAQALGLQPTTRAVSAFEVDSHRENLVKYLQQTTVAGNGHAQLRAAGNKLEMSVSWLKQVTSGELIRCLPPMDGSDTWTAPALSRSSDLVTIANGPRLSAWPSAPVIDSELTYNRWRPTRLSWIVLAGAFVLMGLAWLRRSKTLNWFALGGSLGGFGLMTWGIALRWEIAGRIPAANMYESLLFLAWGVGLAGLLVLPLMRNRLVLINANGLAALTMALADLLPLDSFIHPMPPVLSGTPWLAIHVPIIMLSYSILALGVVVAHVQVGMMVFSPGRGQSIKRMSRVLYWYIHVGCLLLTAGIITGSVWAASSWGRYWGWDPKEVWSLVALLAYLALLHARKERMVSPFAIAAISIVAFQSILMTYLGVNFVLSAGLHSYAVGDSPVARWMILIAVVEIAFLLFGVAARKRQRTLGESSAASSG